MSYERMKQQEQQRRQEIEELTEQVARVVQAMEESARTGLPVDPQPSLVPG